MSKKVAVQKDSGGENGKGLTEKKPFWVDYEVVAQFVGRLCGNFPKNLDVALANVVRRMPEVKPAEARPIEDIQQEVVEAALAPILDEDGVEEKYAVNETGFQAHNGGLAVRTDTFRKHLNESATKISIYYVGRVGNERAFATRFKDCLYYPLERYWTPIMRDGEVVTQADGQVTRTLTVKMKGRPITAFKRFDYIERPTLTFALRVLGGAIPQADLETVLGFGGIKGYLGERSMGEGKYLASVRRLD